MRPYQLGTITLNEKLKLNNRHSCISQWKIDSIRSYFRYAFLFEYACIKGNFNKLLSIDMQRVCFNLWYNLVSLVQSDLLCSFLVLVHLFDLPYLCGGGWRRAFVSEWFVCLFVALFTVSNFICWCYPSFQLSTLHIFSVLYVWRLIFLWRNGCFGSILLFNGGECGSVYTYLTIVYTAIYFYATYFEYKQKYWVLVISL